MAKGNLFLGFGSGKVGDVVLYRANGEQLSRARNRSPRNPKSDRQTIQRAVAASVQRLYSVGQSLFNHAFEGKAPGMECQREFVKRNMAILRNTVVDEINAATADADAVGRLSAPGLKTAVPFAGMQVSSGSYPQALYIYDSEAYGYKLPAATSGETIGAYAQRVGLLPGDIYTLGSIALDPATFNPQFSAGDVAYAKVWQSHFAYVQLKVKDSVAGSESPVSGALLATLFDIVGGNVPLSQQDITVAIGLDSLGAFASEQGVLFCIRSRYGEDLRSTSYTVPGRATAPYGLTSGWLLQAWLQGTDLEQQELVLEGKDF